MYKISAEYGNMLMCRHCVRRCAVIRCLARVRDLNARQDSWFFVFFCFCFLLSKWKQKISGRTPQCCCLGHCSQSTHTLPTYIFRVNKLLCFFLILFFSFRYCLVRTWPIACWLWLCWKSMCIIIHNTFHSFAIRVCRWELFCRFVFRLSVVVYLFIHFSLM